MDDINRPAKTCSDYTIAWFCASGTELQAAKVFLDEIHGKPEDFPGTDQAIYTFGRSGQHNILIALISGEPAFSAATAVAVIIKHNFLSIQHGLLVGVGCGVPDERRDIRLGDVAVSVPGYGHSGISYYDFSAGGGQSSAFLNQPPRIFQQAVEALKVQYEHQGCDLHNAILQMLDLHPLLRRRYGQLDARSDWLFEASFEHVGGYGDDWCAACDSSRLILRREREGLCSEIHHGLITSTNRFLEDSRVRDELSSQTGVICFDTISAGVMNYLPCLAIRGIFNYADSHGNREWEGYAAMTAAAYAKDLLTLVGPTKLSSGLVSNSRSNASPLVKGSKPNKKDKEGDGAEEVISDVCSTSNIDPSSTSTQTNITPDISNWVDSVNGRDPPISSSLGNSAGIPELGLRAGQATTNAEEHAKLEARQQDYGDDCTDYEAGMHQNEVGFDSATVQSQDASTARRWTDDWFKKNTLLQVQRFFKQFRKDYDVIGEMPYAAKIAILDTGIDLKQPVFSSYLEKGQISEINCRDFCDPENSSITDNSGHGTHCADLILKVCRTAKLYIAKVFEKDQGDKATPQRIVKAMEWVIERKDIDIIVMAFAFSEYSEEVRNSIRRAQGVRNFLIFAAASNNKHNERNPVGFPARAPEVIRVNSCTGQGHRSKFSPACSQVQDNLATIGEEINAAFPLPLANSGNDGDSNGFRRLSGTSQSTAIMAAIAGLVLEFARNKTVNGPDIRDESKLLLKEGMVAVLQNCMGGAERLQPHEYCFIRPWLLFRDRAPREAIVRQIEIILEGCV